MTRAPRLTPIQSMRQPDGTPCIGCDALSHELAHLHLESVRVSTALTDAQAEAGRLRSRLAALQGQLRQLGHAPIVGSGADGDTAAGGARSIE